MQYGKFASIYDELMKDVDYDAWADYVDGFIPAGCSILECACGTGEISIRLAAKGHAVFASDISEDMLMIAAEKQRKAGLASAKLRFLRMDMRDAALHKKVDCIVSCCDGVNYLSSLEDVKAFFASASALLKPGGTLLFDISSRHKLKDILGDNCFIERGNEAAYMWQNVYDDESKLIRMDLTFFKKCGELYERFDETHFQRAHSVDELADLLDESGFDPLAFGFLTRKQPNESDERIQFFAVKRQTHIINDKDVRI